MISEEAIDALESCKEIIINEIKRDLNHTPGNRCNIRVYYLDSYDGEPTMETITSVYLSGEQVMVDYEDIFGDKYSDPMELFTVDTVAEVLSQM